MLIYEIPDKEEYPGPNALGDALAFIESNRDEYCLIRLDDLPDSLFLILSEKYLNHFSPILEVYEAKRVNKLPEHHVASIMVGNSNLLTKE